MPLHQAKAELFRTLGHPVRVRGLEILQHGPAAVLPEHEKMLQILNVAEHLRDRDLIVTDTPSAIGYARAAVKQIPNAAA